MKKSILIILIFSLMIISLSSAYQITEIQSNPYVGIRQVPNENIVVYPDNSSIVYANADHILKSIDLTPLYENISITYIATKNNGIDVTIPSLSIDGNIFSDYIGTIGYLQINTTSPLNNGSYIEIYILSNETTNKTLYLMNKDHNITYANITLPSNNYGYNLLRLYPTGQDTQQEFYLETITSFKITIDYIGIFNYVTTSPAQIQAQCDRDNVIKWGVFGSSKANEEKDLYFYCNALKEIDHYKYDIGTIERIPYDKISTYCPSQTTTCNFQEIYAVTEDYYVMGCFQTQYKRVAYTVNKNNLSSEKWSCSYGEFSMNTPSIARDFGYSITEGNLEPSQPFYFTQWDNTFFLLNQFRFGSSQYSISNFIKVDGNGNLNRYQKDSPESNDTNSINYYTRNLSLSFGSGRDYYQGNGKGWCSLIGSQRIYCNNGAPINDGSFKNNVYIDFQNGGLSSFYNYNFLPNGSTINFRNTKTQGLNSVYVYDDLDVSLFNDKSTLLQRGTIDLYRSYGIYYAFIDGALFYMPTSGSLYKLSGLPNGDTLPTVEILGQTTTYPEKTCMVNDTFAFKNRYNDSIDTKDINCTDNDQQDTYGEPYITITTDSSVRTEFQKTNFLAKVYDITNDEIHVAYNCFSREQSFTPIAQSNWENYTDTDYNPPMYNVFSIGSYESQTKKLLNKPRTTSYIMANNSLFAGNMNVIVDSNGINDVTYLQDIYLDYGIGMRIDVYNIQNQQIFNISFQTEDAQPPDIEPRFHVDINGKEVFSENNPMKIYQYQHTFHTIEIHIKGTELSYTLRKNNGISYASGIININPNILPPIYMIRYNFLAPSWDGYNDYKNTGVGYYALISGGLYPHWDLGVNEYQSNDAYRYFGYSCDYTNKENGLYYLRTYYNDNYNNDYTNYEERVVQVDSNYVTYLSQIEEGVVVEEERIQQRNAQANEFWCTAIGTCDDNSRFVFALFVILGFTIAGAVYTYRKFENTLSARLVPVLIYSGLFIYFASIKFLPSWYIALNIIFVMGALALTFNPTSRIGNGGM